MARIFPLVLLLILTACSSPKTTLEEIQESGELKVITRNGPTTFYEGPHGPTGFEYELIDRFSKYIGVKTRFIIPKYFSEIIPAIEAGKADIAAAGLTVTDARKVKVRFSSAYQTINSQIIYLSGKHKPRKVIDLIDKDIAVIAGSSHEENLNSLKDLHPLLTWQSVQHSSLEELMQLIIKEEIDYTVGDSNDIAINRRYYPKIKIGFNLSKPQTLAWALPHSQDNSLYYKTIDFFAELIDSGELELLLERYYGHTDRLNFVDRRTFWRHTNSRLPQLLEYFSQASELTGYDWRLLAAIGYQESHWNPKAVSPTGVKGIMMLTLATAKQLGIKDRRIPKDSITGGAKYLKIIEKKIPKRIKRPDRTWLALAGYNIGFGHLEDARILTQRNGGNPDKWADVKKQLPNLSKPEIFKTLKYGYARGQDPVNYVDNIRNYYDLLQWDDANKSPTDEYIFPKAPSIL